MLVLPTADISCGILYTRGLKSEASTDVGRKLFHSQADNIACSQHFFTSGVGALRAFSRVRLGDLNEDFPDEP